MTPVTQAVAAASSAASGSPAPLRRASSLPVVQGAVGGRPRRAEALAGALRLEEDSDGLVRSDLAGIQRARLLAATGQVACEHGVGNVTVAHIVERAGVSRRTFYDIFADVEECLSAALHEALRRAQERVLAAWSNKDGWRDRARRCLVDLLGLFDEDPVLAQLLVVESLGASRPVLEHRLRVLDAIVEAIDRAARDEAEVAGRDTRLSAEGAIGGMLGVLHARISRKAPGRLIDLVGALMGMLVLPYHGAAAVRRELSRPVPVALQAAPDEDRAPLLSDPFKDAGMRLTYRTTRVLDTIADHPGSSNRKIGELAGISDQGQVSKLLARLERVGMVANDGEGAGKGEPNSWSLTGAGRRLIRNLRSHTEQAPVRA